MSKLTLRSIVNSLKTAIAWLLKGFFFLVHWVFKLALAVFLFAIFASVILFISWVICLGYNYLIDCLMTLVGPNRFSAAFSVTAIIGSFLGLLKVSTIRTLKNYIKDLAGVFKDLLLPPTNRHRKGGEEKKGSAIGSIIGIGLLWLLLGAILLAVIAVSIINQASVEYTTVHNDIHVNFENTAPLISNQSDNKNGKIPLFTTRVFFSEEAKLEGWLDSKKNEKCEKDHPDSECSQHASDFDSPAVKPNKHLYTSDFLPALKGLSDCGSTEQKVKLEIEGFSSSSGVLATLEFLDNNDKEKKWQIQKELEKVEEGNKKSCYERASGNGDQRLSNAFNLCIAELRARNVKDMLDEIIKSDEKIREEHIKLVRPEWDSYSDMCQQRGFPDTRKEGETECYDTDLGLMNRRVEIRFMELPECTTSSQSNRTPASEAEAQMPTDSQGKACGQSASPVPCSRLGSILESIP